MLGGKYGYYPPDPKLAYEADSLCDAYCDVIGKIYKPYFAKEAERDAMYPDIFETIIPNFLKSIDHLCAKGEFLVGDSLTTADFWIGGLYTNFCANENVGFAKERWQAILEEFPNFKAYGERFAQANSTYLGSRPSYPI